MRISILLFSLLLLFSCSNSNSKEGFAFGNHAIPNDALALDEEIDIEPPRTSEPPAAPEFSLEKASKIIKNGNLAFEVTKLEKTKVKIDSLIASFNGYYENEVYNSYHDRTNYSLQIRVPNVKFDSLVYQLESGVGSLKSKRINAKDVTEEYVDLTIRMENNLAYLKQYQEILKKANSIKEILDVKERIRKIEEEIESKKGRLRFLDDKVKYSTLNLEVSELITTKISNKPNFGRRIINAFNGGVKGFLSFLVAFVSIWPFFLLIAVLIVFWRPLMRKIRRK